MLQTLKKFSKNAFYFGFIDETKSFVSLEIDITNYVCNLYYSKNNDRYSFPFRYIKKLENNPQKFSIKFILKDTQLKMFTCLSEKDYTDINEIIDQIIKNSHQKVKSIFKERSALITLLMGNYKVKKLGDVIVLLMNNRVLMFDPLKSEELPILVLCIQDLVASKRGKTDLNLKIKKRDFEISYETENERDSWYEAFQKASTMKQEEAIKIENKLDSLTILVYSQYNPTNESQISLMQRLWDGTIKKIVQKDMSLVSEFWKKLGFENATMESNAKEKGFFLAVEGLVFLMEQYPSVFKLIFNNSQTKNFPLCIVSCKFVDWLSQLLGLEKQEKGIPMHFPTINTFPNFTHDIFAFETIFGITLQLFDEMWKHGSMNITEIVEGVINQITQFLEKIPKGGIPNIYENMLFVLGEKTKDTTHREYGIEKETSFSNKFILNKEASISSTSSKSLVDYTSPNLLNKENKDNNNPLLTSNETIASAINDISIFSQKNWFSKYLDSSQERRDVMTLPIDFNSRVSLEQLSEKRILLKQLNQSYRKLTSGLDSKKTLLFCVSCKENSREIAYLPCSHLALCTDCHTKKPSEENCPVCKTKTMGFLKINKK